jgi:hypothetical protein
MTETNQNEIYAKHSELFSVFVQIIYTYIYTYILGKALPGSPLVHVVSVQKIVLR